MNRALQEKYTETNWGENPALKNGNEAGGGISRAKWSHSKCTLGYTLILIDIRITQWPEKDLNKTVTPVN